MFKFFVKLWQCFFAWRIAINFDHELSGADVIIGQSFGLRKNEPGISNEALASELLFVYLQLGRRPVIVQWEIADRIAEIFQTSPSKFKTIQVIRKHRIPEKYLDTREVLLQTKRICDVNGWKKAVIFAHQDHLWRVKMMAEKIGFEVLIPPMHLRRNIPYDPLSAQWWTRNRFCSLPKKSLFVLPACFLAGYELITKEKT